MGKHNTLVYNMYQITHRNCENGISLNGWTATITSLLFSLGLNFVTNPSYRYSFLKFVTKNHNLPAVRGKWSQPKLYNERLCSTCEVLGDEYHFLLQCTKHQDLRLKFIARNYWERPSMHKFVELMSSQREVVIIKLAAFVHIRSADEF